MTTIPWWAGLRLASEADRKLVLDYIDRDETGIHWSFVRLAWASVANTAIAPMQDLLGLRFKVTHEPPRNSRWELEMESQTGRFLRRPCQVACRTNNPLRQVKKSEKQK